MNDLNEIINRIKEEKPIKLSMDSSKSLVIISVLFVWVASFLLIRNYFISMGLNVILAGIVLLVLNVFMIYQFFRISDARLEGRSLKLKKILGSEINIDIDEIVKIRSFSAKSTKYTTIRYVVGEKINKALIVNSDSALFGREISAGDVLKKAKEIYKKQ